MNFRLEILDEPDNDGTYVVWIDEPGLNWARREIMLWLNGRWYYRWSDQRFRGRVYQCLGPLPALELYDEDCGDTTTKVSGDTDSVSGDF